MKVIDTVKPEPTNSLEVWSNWLNRMQTDAVLTFKTGKHIEVKQLVGCEACGGTAIFEDPICNNCKQENYRE